MTALLTSPTQWSGIMRAVSGYLLVFLGAGLGGTLRHAVNRVALHALAANAATATFAINVVGSLALGVLAGFLAFRGHAAPAVQLFLATGILGGFTTFSTFSLEAALYWQRGQIVTFVLYTAGSVGLSIAAVFVGLGLARLHHAA